MSSINFISDVGNLTYFTCSFIQDLHKIERLIKRITKYVLKIYPFLSQGTVVGFGLTDLFVQGIYKKRKIVNQGKMRSPHSQNQKEKTNYYVLRGQFLTASGVCGEISCYLARHPETYNTSILIFRDTANLLYLAGQIVTLAMNTSAAYQKRGVLYSKTAQSQMLKNQFKDAILGLVNSIISILGTALLMMDKWVALAVVFGGIAFLTGVIQLIYEWKSQVGAFAD